MFKMTSRRLKYDILPVKLFYVGKNTYFSAIFQSLCELLCQNSLNGL